MILERILALFMFVAMLAVACVGAQEPAAPGAIVGVVRFTGDVPPPQKILTSDGAVILHSDLVVDAKSKGLRDVAVVMQNVPARALPRDAKPVVVDQRDMLFLPRVVIAHEGQKVRFDNNDLCNHAVMSSTTTTDNLFNVLTPQGQPFDFAFKAQKSPVQIGCPLHPWMRAWVYVLPHPFAAVTDAQGRFKIESMAPGKHTVQFSHPDTGLRETRSIEVTAGKAVRLEVDWARTMK